MTQDKPAGHIVLVVDDSPETLSMLTDALEDAGMSVLVALEGSRALEMVARIRPDIVLMDAVMPGMDGFETTRRLKRQAGMSHVPIIFMTGLTETEHIVAGFEAGGVDYLTKPISPDELLARVRVHLANARVTRSAQAALDASGRHLVAANLAGRLLWATPQASALLAHTVADFALDTFQMSAGVLAWLQAHARGSSAAAEPTALLESEDGHVALQVSFVGQIGPDEFVLRLAETSALPDETILKQRLALTQREAEVLMWVARGKSNRDIGEILQLSPRTVNKHLELIYAKLGIENRASAAAMAVRILGAG